MWDCQEVLRHGCRAARASEACGCWSVMPEALNVAPLELRCLRQISVETSQLRLPLCNVATCASTLNLLNEVTESGELAKKSRLCFERRGALARALARALAVTWCQARYRHARRTCSMVLVAFPWQSGSRSARGSSALATGPRSFPTTLGTTADHTYAKVQQLQLV